MQNEQQYTILSLIIAIIVIGGAYVYTNWDQYATTTLAKNVIEGTKTEVTPEREKALVDPRRSEHRLVQGGTDPQVTIVEFSDFECPFCSRLHPTLEKIVETYGDDVAWEYRHLPLVSHPNARSSAIASECVADIAGTEAFWNFTKYLFANQRSLGTRVYEAGALAEGIEAAALQACMDRPDIAERVLEDERIAMVLGGGGTPFSVILYADGTTRAVPGALPYNQFSALVER